MTLMLSVESLANGSGCVGLLEVLPDGVTAEIILDDRLPMDAWPEFCAARRHASRLSLIFKCADPVVCRHWWRALNDFARYESELRGSPAAWWLA